MTAARPASLQRQRGAALILVLWMSVFMALLLASAVALARGDARITTGRIQAFKIDEALKSALDRHAFRMATEQSAAAPAFRTTLDINGLTVETKRSDDAKKLDLNLAGEGAIAGFFAYLGAAPDDAAAYAARIADWRDEDDLSRPNGAEARDYADAENGERIGNRPFYSVAELSAVKDLPPALIACAAPAMTIFGDADPADADFLTALYGRAPETPNAPLRVRLGTSSRAAAAGARYAITAALANDDPNGDAFVRTGVFRISGDRNKPVLWITQFQHAAAPRAPQSCVDDANR
ncbi:MAG: hypothetical protein AAGJ87_02055 [Pseudomonadota bacterium]